MSVSRQSPFPPPQSPLIALGEEKLNTQLVLEERLRIAGEELLEVYKNSRQWKQVAQIAQTLNSNSERITCIRDCLSSNNVFEIPPTESGGSTSNEVPSMVEVTGSEIVSVKLSGSCGWDDDDDSPCWEVASAHHSKGRHVSRTPKDVSLLLHHFGKGSPLASKDGSVTSPDALQEILKHALEEPSSQTDPLLLSFLSPSVDSFSVLATEAEGDLLAHRVHEKQTINNDEQNELLLHTSEKGTNTTVHTVTENGSELHSGSACAVQNGNGTCVSLNEAAISQSVNHHDTENTSSDHKCKVETNEEHVLNNRDKCLSEEVTNKAESEEINSKHMMGGSGPEERKNEDELGDEREEPLPVEPIEDKATVIEVEEPVQQEEETTSVTGEKEKEKEVMIADERVKEEDAAVKEEPIVEDINVTEDSTKAEEVTATFDYTKEEEATITEDPMKKEEVTMTEDPTVTETEQETTVTGENEKEKEVMIADERVKEEDAAVKKEPIVEDIIVTEDSTKGEEEVKVTKDHTKEENIANECVREKELELGNASQQESGGDSNESEEAVQSPSKNGLEVTSAQLFISPSNHQTTNSSNPSTEIDQEVPTVPPVTDTPIHDTNIATTQPEEDTTTAELTDIKEDRNTSCDSTAQVPPVQQTAEKGSSSTFFVNPDHMTEAKPKGQSPKETRRIKSYSMFQSKSESPPPDQEKVKLSTKLKRSFKRTNKIKRETATESSVSLLPPELATNWDPTCILEELYADCRPSVPRSSTGENCRYAGYLDKLPVNQSKPAVMKGWKHRYFRITRGSLFYYEDDKSQKALSFVRLADSKMVLHQESLKVEIVEKGGNFIFLRAETRENVVALHRALQLESVHPTLTHRISLSPNRSMTTVIIDFGSCSVRAGLVSEGDNYPQVFFPNVCAFSNNSLIACGSDSLLPCTRGVSKLVYPRRHRARMDSSSTVFLRDCFCAIMETVCRRLNVKPETSNILVSISPIMPENEQQILAEVLLETLGFQGLLMQEQTTLALYSYNCTTGVSVNVGDSISVVPIVDGYKVEGADQHIPLGGSNVSESLSKLAAARDIRYFSDTEMYIIRQVKESLCFVSQNYEGDAVKCEETPSLYTRAVDVDRFQLPDHKKVIVLDIALFKAPEGLFQPALWGKDVLGVHEMIHRCIEQCPIDMKRDMARHIYISGGTSMMAGFPERLKAELTKLLPRIDVVIHADENRHHSAYLGAAILTSLNSFQESLVTLDDYTADGLEAFKKNET